MAAWLVEHFVWIALGLVGVLVGLKFLIGGLLKQLMDASAAEAAARHDPGDGPGPGRG
ncbi:hypothetical protein [Thioalkalivibrio paradoxus]|uniref:Uncharacterized protein n=1 Tax=Thioalkalivibrio paradoxus ARh 1 TaxID=713585 RepID=W0DS01_9GAMM|nr:hypothetical protein [Thioalkalivibrio paradoxus]AHF00053.1 hypothetical protein THITH_08065 [Thioalkalivibrio paradoxus ARh 1]